jgi:hypothetical protein
VNRNDPSDFALAGTADVAWIANGPVPPSATASWDDVPADTVVASWQGVACASSILEIL